MRIADVVRYLVGLIGTWLTAFIAGAGAAMVGGWGRGGGVQDDEAAERLRAASEICHLLTSGGESDDLVRAWWIGMSPGLDGEAPAEAVRDGRFGEVRAAAEAYGG